MLISSAILTHRAINSATINLSFDYEKMVVAYPHIYDEDLPPPVARVKLDTLVARLAALPGVDSVTAAVIPPLSGRRQIDVLPGLPPIYTNYVAPSYFATMTVAVIRGRALAASDSDVAVVSESAARAIWPNEDPIGKTWNFGPTPSTIVGIVKDSGANLLADSDSIEIYLPIDAASVERSALILRAKGDPSPLLRSIQAAGDSAGEPVSSILMRTTREQSLDGQRKMITVIGSLGTLATLLAAAGMFALLAFAVAQRTREIGIRMAIGASPGDIVRSLVTQHAAAVVSGAVLGIILALALGRIARSLKYIPGGQEIDPVGFGIGLLCFGLIAGLATLSPVLKALRIDPSSTLRYE